MNKFENALRQINWDMLYNLTDVNIAYDLFIERFTSLFTKCCPIKVVKAKHKSCKPCKSCKSCLLMD